MSLFKDYGYSSWEEAFHAVIEANGLTKPKDIIPDGKIHRYSTNGKNHSLNGWYFIHLGDMAGGCIGDWSTGAKANWHFARPGFKPTAKQESEIIEKWNNLKKQAEAEHAELAKVASTEAQKRWNDELTDATDDHPYLVKKGIKSHGIKTGKQRLYISVSDETGNITSLQSIDNNGNKLFMKNGKIKGGYFLIGNHPTDRLFIAEGYATAASIYEATGVPTAVTFNSGNIPNAVETLKQRFPNVRMTICADNDEHKDRNIGLEMANIAAKKHGLSVKFPRFNENDIDPENYPTDFNDYARLYGKEELGEFLNDKAIISNAESLNIPNEGAKPSRFRILTIDDLNALPPVSWVIDQHIPSGSFGTIYGAPKKGKTFVALDMGLCVASGKDWHGHTVKQGSVLYILGEGVGGMGKRIKAWLVHNKETSKDLPFFIIPVAVNMRNPEEVQRLMVLIEETGQKFSLIFIDTVARALLGGDENSSTDMGQFIASCDTIKEHTGATVIGIHHSGKDEARGMRGSNSLLGALDTCIRVNREDNLITMKVEEQKDAEPAEDKIFKMETVQTGISTNSLVLIQSNEQVVNKKVNTSPTERLALQYLYDATLTLPVVFKGNNAVKLDFWKQECYRRELTIGTSEQKRVGFKSVLGRLRSKGYICFENGHVWSIKKIGDDEFVDESNSEIGG